MVNPKRMTRSHSTSPSRPPKKVRTSKSASQSNTVNSSGNKTNLKSISSKKKTRTRQVQLMCVGTKTFRINKSILREIRRLQISTKLLIPRLPFSRLIREVLANYGQQDFLIQRLALDALQEASEAYVSQYFEDGYACCLHARRSTLIPRDMALVAFLRRSYND
ncbi:hypothetical protein RI129_002169 [Pyrocoelia pectoralis]|uniref:Core Histone H2A/H2B/H3 domain-containing protein n=1 Tax=Pyrocoelia pectoralis TaxID=417401 RepID=A0AAN7VG51_9COLE